MSYVKACTEEALKEATKLRVEIDGQPVLFIYFEGKAYALDDRCPHLKASLAKGTVVNGVVTCAKHGAQIDVKTGEVLEKAKVLFLKLPTKKAIRYETKIEAGNVLVKL